MEGSGLGALFCSAVIQHPAHLVPFHILGSQMLQEQDSIWIITTTCSSVCTAAPWWLSACLTSTCTLLSLHRNFGRVLKNLISHKITGEGFGVGASWYSQASPPPTYFDIFIVFQLGHSCQSEPCFFSAEGRRSPN